MNSLLTKLVEEANKHQVTISKYEEDDGIITVELGKDGMYSYVATKKSTLWLEDSVMKALQVLKGIG